VIFTLAGKIIFNNTGNLCRIKKVLIKTRARGALARRCKLKQRMCVLNTNESKFIAQQLLCVYFNKTISSLREKANDIRAQFVVGGGGC